MCIHFVEPGDASIGDSIAVSWSGIEESGLGTTSLRMKLTAALRLLIVGREAPHLMGIQDNGVVVDGINGQLANWKYMGWRKNDGSPVCHTNLWEQIFNELQRRPIGSWYWAHAYGHGRRGKCF